jgi:hypothetical protein
MSNLRHRIDRLEQVGSSGHCLLCQLILEAVGKPVAEAAALARHAAHTLEEIVLESMRSDGPAVPPAPAWRH